MKKIIITASAIIFFVALFAGVITPQPGPNDDKPKRERMHDKLNLTADQDTKIESMRSAHMKNMVDLKAELEKAEIDAKTLRSSDNISRADAIASVEKISKIKNQIALASVNHRMDVYEILTPEQRKLWQEGRENMRDNFKDKRKHMREMRGERMKKMMDDDKEDK